MNLLVEPELTVIPKPVFFKKLPITETTKPNAAVTRVIGELHGEAVVEIIYHGETWQVRASECLDPEAALSKRAEELHGIIEAQKAKHTRKDDLLRALGICDSTYRRWNQIILNHLKK